MYRIEIDRSLCSGFGTCAETTPGNIDLGTDGLAAATEVETDDAEVVEAAAACPMGAIAVFGRDGRQVA